MTELRFLALRWACLMGAATLWGSCAWAQTVPAPQPATDSVALSYEAARARMIERSDKLAASHAAVESKALQRKGYKHLGGPSLAVSGFAYHYSTHVNLDLDPLAQGFGQVGQTLPPSLQGFLGGALPTPPLPNDYALSRSGNGTHASLSAVWPLYLGGGTDAVRGFVDAQRRETEADAAKAGDEVDTLLVERYFGAQLARRAAALRQQAERTIARHDRDAQKMLAEGVISRMDRLQAAAAYEEARRQARKADNDAALAATALTRTLRVETAVSPQTPLFVISQPIEPLGYFINAAIDRHPSLAKIEAKKAQAEQLHEGEQALRRPKVFAFGTRELKRHDADWVAGVGVRWTLLESVDRDALSAASRKQVEQAERLGAQARSDIALLVERNWRAVENARMQYLDMQASVDLAQEGVRLRTAGLREGVSTTLDLIDAETNLAKVQTERAKAANDFVQALAQLLESAGLAKEFTAYAARADITLN